ncbi:ABC-type sugar transport system, ATPase component [Sphaerochaeta pleomorpha str. Grapes]|uniref:ABC-type sugar transport system, ATPase component n=2 Tax=Sphaerochaeta TaxID=399320 RepID=G8QVP5_SPHPG|nr:ABC-type sugar transport system, ATPase component [Sphaerochaeta pleomorpha str. Grapes]
MVLTLSTTSAFLRGCMENLFLSMHHISKQYAGVRALDNVDFTIREGEIHCLVGTNGSGKSTLVKIISGVIKPSPSSEIEIYGKKVSRLTSAEAKKHGIEVIYQDLSLFPNLTVQENISLSGLFSGKKKTVSWKQCHETALTAMGKIGIALPLDCLVSELSMADQQLVAICRALTRDIHLLIMDEPTTALTTKEIEALLNVVVDLKSKGIATLFISHKLNEIMEVAERVSVIRDGKMIGCFSSSELDDKKIEFYMTGENISYCPYHIKPDRSQIPLLEMKKVSRRNSFKDIDFRLYRGEIVGITGLLGSGRTELALSLFGLNPFEEGEILIDGKMVTIDSVQKALAQHIAYVPENRLAEGVILDQSIGKNIVITVLDRMMDSLHLLAPQKMRETINHWVNELHIKIPSEDSSVKTLSGGNQQRVVIAKWIATDPRIFILDNPTVGIDIAAKASIHSVIKSLAVKGLGIIIISDEIPEVLYNCNRVLVMNRGRIIKEFDSASTTEDDIQSFIASRVV